MNVDKGRESGDDALTQAIIGAAMEVSNLMGNGFLEAVYRKALACELALRNSSVRQEVEFNIKYKGTQVGRYIADMIVADAVVVETKAVDAIHSSHIGQTLNYMRASGLNRGLILNFGTARLGFKCVVL